MNLGPKIRALLLKDVVIGGDATALCILLVSHQPESGQLFKSQT
jgi:hypothetical protein